MKTPPAKGSYTRETVSNRLSAGHLGHKRSAGLERACARINGVTSQDMRGKRVLLLGAETELGQALASALAEAGADVAVVAATTDAGAAFAVQRLSRRLIARGRRSLAQAIDGTNEMAVRVMVRQVGKELAGLDAIVFCVDLEARSRVALELALRFGAREMARKGGRGRFVLVSARTENAALDLPPGVEMRTVATGGKGREEVVEEVLASVAGRPDNE